MRAARLFAICGWIALGLTGCLRLVDFEETPEPCPHDECTGECVDLRSSSRHCGSCTTTCLSDQTCIGGQCSCTTGVACASGCSSLDDDANCGACGKACPTGCKNGTCDCLGAYCSNVCVDLQQDDANCGVCGHACPPAYVCIGGQCGCANASQKPCNGKCVPVEDTETDCDCGPDSDGDGVCDELDPCPSDAPDDTDGDGKCNGADPCPLDKPDDSDGDGKCNSTDPCPQDAADDQDGDGACDSDDPCPLDKPNDTDGDGVCDTADLCPGHFDGDDVDSDGIPDACDPCPSDATGDTDGDGVCDSVDQCALGSDADDADGDLIPNACDLCPVSDKTGDGDGSGFPDVCEKVLFTLSSEEFSLGPAPSPLVVQFYASYSNLGQGGPCDGVSVGDDLDWSGGQTGTYTFQWKDDPDVVAFKACAVDGKNEWLGQHMSMGTTGAGGSNTESLHGLGFPDLQGKTVTYLRLQVSEITATTIGTVPAVHVEFAWRFLGYEP